MKKIIKCPYCEAKLPSVIVPNFTSKCCGRIVCVTVNTYEGADSYLEVFRPTNAYMKENELTGDNSRLPKMQDSRPHSKWTIVARDGLSYYVRLIPSCLDLEDLGRPWGLALGNLYEDRMEAHKFADSVDIFMDAMADSLKKGNA